MNEFNPNAQSLNQEFRNRSERFAAQQRFAQEQASHEKLPGRFQRFSIRLFAWLSKNLQQTRRPSSRPRILKKAKTHKAVMS